MADHVVSPAILEVSDSSSTDTKPKNEIIINESSPDSEPESQTQTTQAVPLKWKLGSILMVSAIGFGSNWSSGITGAMKSTIKKEMKINNTQFALLEASEDFMVTALMLISGLVTDRIGGAGILPLPFCGFETRRDRIGTDE
jgi:hypothetical protein